MSAPATMDKPATAARPKTSAARCHTPGGQLLGNQSSREAQRAAALILEVLAGGRTPTQAAEALSVSLPRYYQLETRAMRGLLAACEARPRGPGHNVDKELAALRRQHERVQRELMRQQTLVRLAQRTIGLTAPPPPAAKAASGKKRRRAVVRALQAAAHLHQQSQEAPVAETPATEKTA